MGVGKERNVRENPGLQRNSRMFRAERQRKKIVGINSNLQEKKFSAVGDSFPQYFCGSSAGGNSFPRILKRRYSASARSTAASAVIPNP